MELVSTAGAHGVSARSIQIDYDCPTSGLGEYAALLRQLRTRMPDTELSITALPSWLGARQFRLAARNVSYFVLQVHSLEKPRTVADPIILCDTRKIPGYLRSASALGVPFMLALPTYGYRVSFDEEGRFASLCAEGPFREWRPGFEVRLAMSDPVKIAGVVRALSLSQPAHFLGLVWFRLPVDSDDLNWSWPTLLAVMAGRASLLSRARPRCGNRHQASSSCG